MFTSLFTNVGIPTFSSITSTILRLSNPAMFGVDKITRRLLSIVDGNPIEIPTTCLPSACSARYFFTSSIRFSTVFPSAVIFAVFSILNSCKPNCSSTRPARMLVPPTSIPNTNLSSICNSPLMIILRLRG